MKKISRKQISVSKKHMNVRMQEKEKQMNRKCYKWEAGKWKADKWKTYMWGNEKQMNGNQMDERCGNGRWEMESGE